MILILEFENIDLFQANMENEISKAIDDAINEIYPENTDEQSLDVPSSEYNMLNGALDGSITFDDTISQNYSSEYIYSEIRANSSNKYMEEDACSILYNLKKCSEEKKIPYGYFNDWEQVDYGMKNSQVYRKQIDGKWYPKNIDEINLQGLTVAEFSGGYAPSMALLDFYKFIGTDNYYHSGRNKASTLAIVKKVWAENRILPTFSWHLENPYAPIQYNHMKCRYKDPNHPDIVSEILNNTGSPCCFNKDYPNGEFKNPREWFDHRLVQVASAIREMKDENGEQIPIILRLWHECEDSWAWWQLGSNVSPEEYKQFFIYTVTRLNELSGTNKIIIVFNTDRYLLKYYDSIPTALDTLCPLEYVDVISYDDYFIGKKNNLTDSIYYAQAFSDYAKKHNKLCAIAETGAAENVSKELHWEHLCKVFNSPNVNLAYINEWVSGTYSPKSDSLSTMDAYAKITSYDKFYNFYNLPNMTKIEK